MSTIAELMRVLQFGDSLLPVGAFSFSNGLESAVQFGVVHDLATLRDFVRSSVEQAATSDGVAVLSAFRAAQLGDAQGIDLADHAVFERKLNEEMRTMTTRMGRKLAEMSERVLGPEASAINGWLARIRAGATPGCMPVAQALVFLALGLSERDAFAVHQYGVASMMANASLRLMRIHYLDVQSILFEVNADAGAAYDRVAAHSLEDMAAFAPAFDVLASLHVGSFVRMFMN
ncbi:urease accessory protein UreF [Singulisphaera sp. PoT]|uniref:urease accessory protein UreF n=1 Tax=Singulisphaera sp. PoT TaxID=3411797 RepID=UPI003BF4A933